MSTETVDLTTLYREAFAVMRDALDVPLAAFNLGGERARETLLQRRADAVLTAASALSRFTFEDMIREEIEYLRHRVSQLPVSYRPVVGVAKPIAADCMICGPDCCSPVVGVHDSCPGPLVGRTVLSVR